MSRKELMDAFFKVSAILIMIAALFIYYNNSDVSRYRYNKNDMGHYVFDTCTGKLYLYATDVKSKKSGWGVYPLCETPQIKPVDDFKEMK